ncbi:MAG: aldehyde dehydrogenase family protein [Pseudomonadota bacterium]
MSEHIGLMIPGREAPAGQLTVTSPFDGRVLATLDQAGVSDVDAAMTLAYETFRHKRHWLEPSERLSILERAAEIMRGRKDELALTAAAEGGKPLPDSMVEVNRAIESVMACVETARHETGDVIPMNLNAASKQHVAMTTREPIGVVVAVSAFNHPLNLIAHQVAPAVAVGCPVIVKPADDTPISCVRFVEILREAGLPDAWCQVVIADGLETAEALVVDPRVAFFSFIGSAKVGWMLRSKLSPGTRCALEHGGAAPAIVAADANLDSTLPSVLKGGFYHAGQVCVSVQRLFVQQSIAEDVARRLADEAEKLVVGAPENSDTEVGPLIRPAEVTRVHQWVEQAKESGGVALTGGEVMENNCYRPTVLFNPSMAAKVSQMEIFGPVVCVYPYKDLDEVFEQANSLDYAFQAAVYTQDIDYAMSCYRGLDASAVMVNQHTAFRVDWMPFAGLNQSGLGVGGIRYTMHDMQIEKMLVLRSPSL